MNSAGLANVNRKLGGRSDGEGMCETFEREGVAGCECDQNALYACMKLCFMKVPPVIVVSSMPRSQHPSASQITELNPHPGEQMLVRVGTSCGLVLYT